MDQMARIVAEVKVACHKYSGVSHRDAIRSPSLPLRPAQTIDEIRRDQENPLNARTLRCPETTQLPLYAERLLDTAGLDKFEAGGTRTGGTPSLRARR